MNQNVRESDLSSKLVLLTLSFPKLRIIWSSNPNETATVFEELKVKYIQCQIFVLIHIIHVEIRRATRFTKSGHYWCRGRREWRNHPQHDTSGHAS
jgi:ERCC4-type nuclease